MGSRSKEEKPFAFYDPEQDRRQGQRQGAAPPISPRAQAPGRSFHNPESMDHDTSYGVQSRGVGRGAYPPPQYTKQESGNNLPMPQEVPRNASYGRASAPEPAGYAGRGTAPSRPHTQPDQELVGTFGRGRGNGYGDGEAGTPNSYGRASAPEPAGYAGRGTAPSRPHTQPDQELVGTFGRGRGNGYGDGEAGNPNSYGRASAPEPAGYAGRGTAPFRPHTQPDQELVGTFGRGRGNGYGDGEAGNPNSYGRASAPEPAGYAGRGTAPFRPHTQPDQELVGTFGRGRGNGYGDGEAGNPNPRPVRPPQGASQGRGRGSSMPLGDGRYVYSGLQRPYEFEADSGAPPAPISSEYAHEAYASVFSDPVYGGALQFNARAGYSEEPTNLQELHHKEDVLRNPDQF